MTLVCALVVQGTGWVCGTNPCELRKVWRVTYSTMYSALEANKMVQRRAWSASVDWPGAVKQRWNILAREMYNE